MSRRLVGFHGKLPNVGDFVQRRLPASFVHGWDAAMQSTLAAIPAALGHAWRDRFLESVPCRFALATNVCDSLPWVGVVTASRDKVGRVYPLVLAVSPPVAADGWPRIPDHAWFDALAAAAVRSKTGIDVSLFDALVAMLPDPATSLAQHLPPLEPCYRSLWWQDDRKYEGVALTGMPEGTEYLRLTGLTRNGATA